jgi:hypothetical protein
VSIVSKVLRPMAESILNGSKSVKVNCPLKGPMEGIPFNMRLPKVDFKTLDHEKLKIYSEPEAKKLVRMQRKKVLSEKFNNSILMQSFKAYMYARVLMRTGLQPSDLKLKSDNMKLISEYYISPFIKKTQEEITTFLVENTGYIAKNRPPHFKAFNHKSFFQFFN